MSSAKPTVFIHGKRNQWVSMKVAEHSLRRNSKYPDFFGVRSIFLEDYPFLCDYERRVFKKDRRAARWRKSDPQSFVLLRFLPPQLMNYENKAVVIDPDIFAVGDIYELLSRDMKGKAILCYNGETVQTASKGIRQDHLTSVMLLDCARLKHWQWENQVAEMFRFKRYYNRWMVLGYEPPESIGPLEEEWNHRDILTEHTKLLHNTHRSTQPWMTGLPYGRTDATYEDVEKIWGFIPKPWWKGMRCFVRGEGYLPYGRHEKHPDPAQEKFFFSLLKECVQTGFIPEKKLRKEVQKKHVRQDIFQVLDTL